MHIKQTIERPFGVNVFGSYVMRVDPDWALLRLAVNRVAPSPPAAFSETRDAVTRVRTFLRGRGLADRDVQASTITLKSVWKHRGGERAFAGHEATVEFVVSLTDLTQLETVLSGAVEAGAESVRGVTFQTRRLRELRAQARTNAVAAARRKAEVFCAAAGTRLGNVIHIEDVDPSATTSRGYAHEMDADLAGENEREEPGAYNPGGIRVSAAVMIAFAILP